MKNFKTKDSALSFYLNQLENFDPKLHQPLTSVSWGRDIDLRSGITMSNESTSFVQSSFASGGTLKAGGLPFIGAEGNSIPGISIDGQKVTTPLRLLGREISYTSVELDRSALLGQPIDSQKLAAFNTMYQMSTDQMVYIGAAEVNQTGLINNSSVTSGSVATGASSSTHWSAKTPNEILADVNSLLTSVWEASALAACPSELRVPPTQFGLLASTLISTAGNMSVLKFLSENSICNNINGKPLNIQPLKWAAGAGASGTDRMIAYTKSEDYLRFTMVPVRRETAYYQGIRFIAPYIWAYGGVEFVYSETIQYADGI